MIHFKSFLRHFLFYFIINLIGLSLFAYMRFSLLEFDAGSELVNSKIEEFGTIRFVGITVFVMSFFLAILTSLVDILIFKRIKLKLPLGLLLILEITTQIVIINVVGRLEIGFIRRLLSDLTQAKQSLPDAEIHFNFIIVLLFFLIGLGRLMIALDRKLGHGNIWKIIAGRFYKPKEEERVFMFIDLKDSTKIAERLGHLRFSELIKNCFSDLSVVDRYRADIYQFVGDEVVLTWCNRNAFRNNNYLRAFYAFKQQLKARSNYYLETYGIEPFFKAGVHAGIVVTTEVGDLKREISYHGDTINTASRIQGLCNNLGAELLISDEVYKHTQNKENHSFEDKGLVDLKGKQQDVQVYKIETL